MEPDEQTAGFDQGPTVAEETGKEESRRDETDPRQDHHYGWKRKYRNPKP